MKHESIREAIAAYALDAIDPGELSDLQSELIDHLAGCEECAALMRDMREVAAELAFGVPPLPLSPGAEDRLLASVRPQRPAGRSGSRRNGLGVRLLSAAAAIALVISGAYNVSLSRRLERARQRVDAFAPLFAVASRGAVRSVELRGKAGSISLAYQIGGRAVLVAAGMPSPPAGRVYELWLIDGRPIPVTTFVPNGGVALVAVDADTTTFRGVAITLEHGFVPAPTTAPLYAGTIKA